MIIKNFKRLALTSARKKGLEIINSGLGAINTEKIIKEKIHLRNNVLIIKNYNNKIEKINIKKYKRIFVIGFGKASSLMGKELEKILKGRIQDGIIISTKKIRLRKIRIIKGTHPMPSLGNIKGTEKIVDLIKDLDKNDLVICLISGGGSALLCYPKINLNGYLKIINRHFSSGIDINRLNKIRKKLSYVKGGKLAKLTKARMVSLIFSDVVGDDLSTIASGPTFGKGLKNVENILLLNNKVALEAMKKKAISLGLKPIILTDKLKGEARIIGKKIIKNLKNKKMALLFAGETTVTVKGKGKGGRNQELCLGAIEGISNVKNCCLVSIGSDGMDGPTDAAGAVVDGDSLEKAKKLGLNYKKYLKNNDSHYFFKKMDNLVFTGLTGSNVADVGVVIKL